MSERLYIRLGQHAEQPCEWLVWSEQEQEIIASGVLANAHELPSLKKRAGNRPVDVLVCSQGLSIHQLTLPEQGQRQMLKALPFMLEEQLVDDVEQMHFVSGTRTGEQLTVIAVSHEQMQRWLAWLHDAELKVRQLSPDVLALPSHHSPWSAIQFGEQYLFKNQQGMGYSLPQSWLEVALSQLATQTAEQPLEVDCFTPMQLPYCQCHEQMLELPLLTLVKGMPQATNLLIGTYKPKRELGKHILVWKTPAIAAAIVVVLTMVNNGLQTYQLQQQADALKAQSEQIYRQAVPQSKRIVNLRSQLKSELGKWQGQGDGGQLFAMLNSLAPSFAATPDLKPDSLRFDSQRGELRMQITAKSYEQIEQFVQQAKKQFTVDTGAMNSRDDQVSSTLTLRSL